MHIKKTSDAQPLLTPPVSRQMNSGFVLLHTGEESGEHVTENREGIIYIIEGEALVTIEGEREYVEAGSIVYIPPHKKHNIKNEADEDLRYMYVVSLFGQIS